jgi:hypothetical protein
MDSEVHAICREASPLLSWVRQMTHSYGLRKSGNEAMIAARFFVNP